MPLAGKTVAKQLKEAQNQKQFMRLQHERIIEARAKFKKGLQTKFILTIKQQSGCTWASLAERLAVCEHTVCLDWKSEQTTIPLSYVKKLFEISPFDDWSIIEKEWITEILPKNWGQIKSGENNKKIIKIPEKSEELAELFGVILGDGHLDRKTLTITGNAHEIEHYHYLQKMVKNLFNLDSKIFKLKTANTIQLRINSTDLIKFLCKHSFVIGDKILNKESLPRWIFEKNEYIYGTLRGLLDTDGGIYQKQKNYKRAIIELQTESPQIRANMFELFRKAGFNPSKSDVNVRIQKQGEVRRFLSLVGCANPKNIMRCKYFIKTGEIPLKEQIWKETNGLKVEKPFKQLW